MNKAFPDSVSADPDNNAGPKAASLILLKSTEPVADFRPDPSDACFCGTAKPFASCCGSTDPDRPPPYGVFIFEDYLDDETARELTAIAEQRDGARLMVIDQNASTADHIVKVEDARRVAERVDLGERRDQVNALVKAAFVGLAERCYGESLEWFEAPDLMRYRPGGFYIKHADSQNMDATTQTWNKVIDRDLSFLLYLNDDYEGGELLFEKFNYRLRPRAGMAVLFPSDSRYLHAAETVTSGVRYAIVSWASVRGVPKVGKRPPEPAIFID